MSEDEVPADAPARLEAAIREALRHAQALGEQDIAQTLAAILQEVGRHSRH